MKRDFDKGVIRNRVETDVDGFAAYYYEDKLGDLWFGNIVVYDGETEVVSAYRVPHPMTVEELRLAAIDLLFAVDSLLSDRVGV